MRFRSEQHLRRQRDIRAVRELGRRLECRAFTVWWKRRDLASAESDAVAPSPAPLQRPRVCVIASTAAVGGAILRNRAKRRLREIFRHHQEQVPADCDHLLIARVAATEWPIAELEKKFSDACRQIPPAPGAAPV